MASFGSIDAIIVPLLREYECEGRAFESESSSFEVCSQSELCFFYLGDESRVGERYRRV